MAFTFTYTLKGASSNSYVPITTYTSGSRDVLGADDYFASHPKYDTWNDLATEEKQRFLVQASRRLDMENFGGSRTNDSQRLQWPRQWVTSRDYNPSQNKIDFNGSFYQDPDFVPKEIEEACFELALFYIEEWKHESPMFSRQDQERMEQVSIGPLSATLRKSSENSLPSTVMDLLRACGPDAWMGNRPLKLLR